MAGRTMETAMSAPTSATSRSPRALVKVYTSVQPSDRARSAPALTSSASTHSSRRRSVSAAVVRYPAWRCTPLGLLAQCGQPLGRAGLGLEPGAHGQPGLGLDLVVDARARADPPGWPRAAGPRCTRWRCARSAGRCGGSRTRPLTASIIRSSSARVPTTLVTKAWSMGGSNETSPAQCTTMSRSAGSGGTFGRSPSMTSIRCSSSASAPPAASRRRREQRLADAGSAPGPEPRPSPCGGPAPPAWSAAARSGSSTAAARR